MKFCYQRRSLVIDGTTCLNLILMMFVYSFWKPTATDASAAKVRVTSYIGFLLKSSSFSEEAASTHEAFILSLCDLLKFSFSKSRVRHFKCTYTGLFLSPQPRLWMALNKRKMCWVAFTTSA